jgi:hypothetical protein
VVARHGWIGLAIVLVAEAALVAEQPLVARWFTPIVWTGYIIFLDALVARLAGRSYLTGGRAEGMLVALVSVAGWWLFEWYNAPRFWRGGADLAGLWWQYHGIEPNPFLRRVGYDWSFATIFPALFLTAAALRAGWLGDIRSRRWHPSSRGLAVASVAGAVCVALPLVVVSAWLVPLVWIGWALLLEPLNYRAGRPSWLRDLTEGDPSTVLSLLLSGALCGVLWEFWNYWAATKWTYTVPYGGEVKVFEMPVLGYLGFPPFALECYAIYHAIRAVIAPPSAQRPLI